MSLDVGDQNTVEVLWADPLTGAPVDGTTTLTITAPDGTVTTVLQAAMSHPSTGLFRYTFAVTMVGVWTYTFTATGAHVETETGYFLVVAPGPNDGPCEPWIGASEVFDCRPASGVAAVDRDYALAAQAADAAARILYILSNRRYPGVCVETVRPCRRSNYAPPSRGWSWRPAWGLCACASLSACGCAGISEVKLGTDYPVLGIDRVRVDGATVAPSVYRVDDGAFLVRIDGLSWPTTQDLAADPATDPDTFDVTYWYGREPTADAVNAARRLASELYMACAGGECGLPTNIQSLVRAGESVAFIDPQLFLSDDMVGIYEVNLFLTTERYDRTHRGTVVASPEFTSSVRRTS